MICIKYFYPEALYDMPVEDLILKLETRSKRAGWGVFAFYWFLGNYTTGRLHQLKTNNRPNFSSSKYTQEKPPLTYK